MAVTKRASGTKTSAPKTPVVVESTDSKEIPDEILDTRLIAYLGTTGMNIESDPLTEKSALEILSNVIQFFNDDTAFVLRFPVNGTLCAIRGSNISALHGVK